MLLKMGVSVGSDVNRKGVWEKVNGVGVKWLVVGKGYVIDEVGR